jgi:single-strand DNA-binding protein
MSSVNKIILVGRLGKDVELKTMTNGNKVANFSVATGKKWKDKVSGETKEKTTWHNIVIWGALADVAARYLHKGDNVYLEGEMDNRSYEKDGVTKYISEVNVTQMVMLGGKSAPAGGGNQGEPAWDPTPPSSGAGQPVSNNSVDDLPF